MMKRILDRRIMNKKGSVLHWIVFGMFAVWLFFLLSVGILNFPLGQTGSWQHGLLYDGFYPSEIRQVEEDLFIKEAAALAAREVAASGGFLQFGQLGGYEGYQLWNAQGIWAEYPLRETLLQAFQNKVASLGYTAESVSSVSSVSLLGTTLLGNKTAQIDLRKPGDIYLQRGGMQYYRYTTGF